MIELIYTISMQNDNGMMLVDNHEFDFAVEHPDELSIESHQRICDFLLSLYHEDAEGLELPYRFIKFSYYFGSVEVDLTDLLHDRLKRKDWG